MKDKTMVMKILEKNNIKFKSHYYPTEVALSGVEVADILNQNPNQVFKTLVTVGASKKHYVFVIPVNKELDLKKCARVVKEKNISMIPQKELLSLTGYIHGGCSPIGMKKYFKTVFDNTSQNYHTIIFSAGKIGYQVELALEDIKTLLPYEINDVTQ